MTCDELKSAVETRCTGLFMSTEIRPTQTEVIVLSEPTRWIEIINRLKDEPTFSFNHLSSLTAVDELSLNRIVVVAHLWSYALHHAITVKAYLPRDNPRIATLEGLYKSADWMEREVFDLFGVVFEGHHNLRRIMMPEDYTKFPLRKDFTDAGFIPKPN